MPVHFVHFVARSVSVEELEDDDTFLIALGDDRDEPAQWLMLQTGLDAPSDEDVNAGVDGYCLVVPDGATHYGGVTRCALRDRRLSLVLDANAVEALGADGFEIDLHPNLSPGAVEALRAGLVRLFQGDRRAPADLVLA